MNLVDAGPLIALIDKNQGDTYLRCLEVAARLEGPMLTTWPCWAEAMYFLGKLCGWPGQQSLWQLWETGILIIYDVDVEECKRMRFLMERYQDVPMDLADASLVAAAETLNLQHIFTLDSDFYVYRINDKDAFEVVP